MTSADVSTVLYGPHSKDGVLFCVLSQVSKCVRALVSDKQERSSLRGRSPAVGLRVLSKCVRALVSDKQERSSLRGRSPAVGLRVLSLLRYHATVTCASVVSGVVSAFACNAVAPCVCLLQGN
ncbi:hypothetical protein MRX96_004443 [Rhipicephalus microplus]